MTLPELSREEVRRYGRHLILPQVGPQGQRRLKAARVLMVGAGGLGSPIGLYLAAAGIGSLGVVEFDRVDETNLQRQVLYGQGDVGRDKLVAAGERLQEVNPHLNLEAHGLRLESQQALDLIADYDIVVDGSDNFATRYLVNDACVLTGKPNVFGAVLKFEGQAAVFWGERGPCYRCLFPEPPPPGLVPSCAEGGVFGVLPGIIGSIQATEVIKLVLGEGEPLLGRLLTLDALTMRFREVRIPKNPGCPVCGDEPTITELMDYDLHCGTEAAGEGDETMDEGLLDEIEVETLQAWLQAGRQLHLLDVRNPVEYQICRLDGAELLPLAELPGRWQGLDRDTLTVVYCHGGVRSAQAVDFLRRQGLSRVVNLAGGIDAWSRRIDPTVPRY
ncbi:MAG: molybdopterin-synthase adenylyltransferase MoeB [Acidobacteriota bacterium]